MAIWASGYHNPRERSVPQHGWYLNFNSILMKITRGSDRPRNLGSLADLANFCLSGSEHQYCAFLKTTSTGRSESES